MYRVWFYPPRTAVLHLACQPLVLNILPKLFACFSLFTNIYDLTQKEQPFLGLILNIDVRDLKLA